MERCASRENNGYAKQVFTFAPPAYLVVRVLIFVGLWAALLQSCKPLQTVDFLKVS
jgi:hypothetical protein